MRAVAYIRESTVRQAEEGYSPDAQRRALKEYADRNDFQLVAEFFDAESGTKETRTGFQAMVAAAERREFEAVLVFRSSRFARNAEVARHYKRRLRAKGIKVVALDVEVDPTTASGFLLESVHEVLDEHYSRQLSEWTKAGFQEKHRQGGHVGGIPVGYDRQADGTLVANADAPAVRKAFRDYATGRYGVHEIARRLADAGVRTRRKEPLGISGVMVMLCNRTYLGYVKRRGEEIKGRHKPLIQQDTFEMVQRQLELRKRGDSRPKKYRIYPLGGLLECAACGARWRGRTDPDRKQMWVMRYYCYGPKDYGCTGKKRVARAEDLEKQVKALVVDRLIFGHRDRDKLLAAIRAEQPNRQREHKRLQGRLQRVKHMYEMGDLDHEEYTKKRDLLTAELAAVQPTEIPPQVTEALDVIENLDKWWDTLPPRAKQTALRFVVESLTVDNGNITAVKVQPWVATIWNGVYLLGLRREDIEAIAADAGSGPHSTQV